MARRMDILVDGKQVSVPVISGNALRGQLRRHAALSLCDLAELESLKTPGYHLLFSGGSLTRGGEDHAHRIDAIKKLTALIPMIDLMGCSLPSEIIPGCLKVDIIWPICRETVNLTGVGSDIQCDQLVSTVMYTRRDGGETIIVEREAGDKSNQMIFEGEVIVAGTRLLGGLSISRATPIVAGCLWDAFEAWNREPRLGGMSARGHGLVRCDPEDDSLSQYASLYRKHVRENKAEIAACLNEVQ